MCCVEKIDGCVDVQTNRWEGGQASCAWRIGHKAGRLYWGVSNAETWDDCWR